MEDDKIVKIDIDKVLQSKMGSKSKFVPRFICNWLKHIVHQEEINAFLESVGSKQGLPWLDAVMDFWTIRLKFQVWKICLMMRADADTRL